MDNVVLKSATPLDPMVDTNDFQPTAPQPESTTTTIEALTSNPLEPVDQTNVDGNVQAHLDVNYQAHDVALAAAKANGHGHEQVNGLKLGDHHQMEIDDGYEHPHKVKACCSLLNKFFLALAIVCFALFLCSIAFIVANTKLLNDRNGSQGLHRRPYPYQMFDRFPPSEQLLTSEYFNLTHPNPNSLIVVLSRRGASIKDILVPFNNDQGIKQYRSIVLQNTNGNHFGVVRFGFDEQINSFNLTNQLPFNYPLLNVYDQDWSMYGDIHTPNRIRFVNGLVEVVYEFSAANSNDASGPNINELMMLTTVSAPVNGEIIADPTNNIYFNLRGHGDLSTHQLNLSVSTPINIQTGEQLVNNVLMTQQLVNQIPDVNKYFYKFNQSGIGKNYIATLAENETQTTVRIFADHTGVVLDPFGLGLSNTSGIRISPKQSAFFQQRSIYGPTLVVYPSQAIHTTWWQFEYQK